MPTLVSAVPPFRPLMLPSTKELLAETCAFAPRAVALLRFSSPGLALEPTNVLFTPEKKAVQQPALKPRAVSKLPVAVPRASSPKAVLLLPVVFELSANAPLAVFPVPVVFPASARLPLAVLSEPVVLDESAKTPIPVSLCPAIVEFPAKPKNAFSLKTDPNPNGAPPILKLVAVVTTPPATIPVALKERPAGADPEMTDHEYGETPPLAPSDWE